MITLDEYRDRRERLIRRVREASGAPDAAVVVQGAPRPEGHTRFRQYNDLRYLCPIETPHAYLTLHLRGDEPRSFLFLHHQPARLVEWEGTHLSAADPDAVRAATGVDAVFDLVDLPE